MNKTPHILICGNYGATNIGDEAILQSILQCVRSTHPKAHITVVSANPAFTAKQYGVEAVHPVPAGFRSILGSFFSKKFRETLKAHKKSDLVIFGGGGLFTDEKPRAIFIWTMQILPALWYRKPIYCFGQSIGPLFMRSSRWTVRFLFRRMRAITVRDEASKNLLEKMDVRNVQVLPDPVFGLHSDKNSHPHHHVHRQHQVVLSLRPWFKRAEKNHRILAEFIDWLFVTYHLKTLCVPFQSEHDNDSEEILKVLSLLEHREAAELLAHNENISEVATLMKSSTAVIGMRLHSVILAAVTETPFLGISYSLKVTEVIRQLGMGNYFCEYRELDLQTLKKKFELLFTYRKQIEKELEEKHCDFQKQTEEYSELLERMLTP